MLISAGADFSNSNTWQQVILFLLIILGSAIFVSIAVLHVRKHAFEIRLQELADRRQGRLRHPMSFNTISRSQRTTVDPQTKREEEIISGVIRGHAIPNEHGTQLQCQLPTVVDAQFLPQPDPNHGESFSGTKVPGLGSPSENDGHIRFANVDTTARRRAVQASLPALSRAQTLSLHTGVGTRSVDLHPKYASPPPSLPNDKMPPLTGEAARSKRRTINKYIGTFDGYIGRNSQFHRLTERERRALGGIEYDALCVLSWIVPLYFVLFQLFGALGCGAWLQINRPDVALQNGLNPFWTGAFFAISAFNNSGMALLDANATALQTSYYMLLTLSLLILAGNTCFPPFLRLILWTMKSCMPKDSESLKWQHRRKILTFILDHPRRVYTNLFPSSATWWLVLSLVLLNGIDWFAFEVLNIGNPLFTPIPARFRAVDGLFQAFAVRAGGFYVVAIASLYPGTLVLYVLMMYLSAFPVTITIRNTNVYEERSLAIFADDHLNDEVGEAQKSPVPGKLTRTRTALSLVKSLSIAHGGSAVSSTRATNPTHNASWTRQDFIRQQLRGQLGHDLWWLALAILFLTIIETSSIHADPVDFSIFNIIFEVVSAYGTVGISVGVPWAAYSFCGAWHTGSKLILCAVMLRGRHRGLPVAIDHAILLPHSSLAWAEEEDGQLRRTRSRSYSVGSTYRRPQGITRSYTRSDRDDEAALQAV